MRALVTGGGGFVGAALSAKLAAIGADVVRTSRRSAPRIQALDVCDRDAVVRAMHGIDVVFHLAARKDRPLAALDEVTSVNVSGAANVLAAAARERERRVRVVLVGSGEEYGPSDELPIREEHPLRPRSAYGVSKAAATQLALAASAEVAVTVVRPASVYGPGEPAPQLIASAIRAARTRGVVTLNGGSQTRDFVFVDDVADALIRASDHADGAARGVVINVGSGIERRIDAVARRVLEIAGSGEIVEGPPSQRLGDVSRSVYDVSRAERLLAWRAATSLDDGIRRTLEIARSSG